MTPAEEAIQIEDQWYVLATSSRADDRTRVLKHGDLFAVFDRYGDIQRIGSGEQGLYFEGTRFLSHQELRVNGLRPMLLNSTVKEDNSLLAADLTTPDLYDGPALVVPRGSVHIFRAKLLWRNALQEHVRLHNYGMSSVQLRLSYAVEADYVDIFEVRGLKRERRGVYLPLEVGRSQIVLGYRGLDGVERRTRVLFDPAPSRLAAAGAEFEVTLDPGATVDLYVTVDCVAGDAAHASPDYETAIDEAAEAARAARAHCCTVSTSNDQCNHWLTRSEADLVMLTTDLPEGPYPYAGVPWYSTPFGRDAIITALQYLWIDPQIARGVLRYLAANQASAFDAERDAEPGKILHETRQGELAALREIPFGRYYGSVDSTPLFIVLAAAYFQRTGDLDQIRALWPNIERALEWIDRHGDLDGDGFVEYSRHSSTGLVNQGWKDSQDAVFHRDGALADAPIALCEVQGYVYQAKLGASELAGALGELERAAALIGQARELQDRFERAFWCPRLGSYALALDGSKRQCAVLSSNAGQVLWSGIASREHAIRTADTLLAPRSFSGWGVRTIAEGEARYNPMSYHNGSIWPHDNAMIAMGMARYGLKQHASRILGAMFEASMQMDLRRLPELYCGFVRRPSEGPTLYPVACSPQAWASASVFYLLQACLGLSFRADAARVRFYQPVLPEYIGDMRISGLRVGNATLDLALQRRDHDVGVSVLRKDGNVAVEIVV
jgi:glycogen debranching enzyme